MSNQAMEKRQYTDEFRAEAVALCLSGGLSSRQVADDLGVKYQTLCHWVQKARREQPGAGGLAPTEREELNRLRKENVRLRMERDILKKATAFFASENR